MTNKKICMLGAFCVGKTALVRQYVSSIFSDNYLSTVGVKISKKVVKVSDDEISLVLWDMEGQDHYSTVNLSYLRGANGLLFVIDGTRGESLSVALKLRSDAIKLLGPDIPHYFLVNKADLEPEWEITAKVLATLENRGIKILKTSAKTGLNVEQSFSSLTRDMLEAEPAAAPQAP
ncbi:MAG: GTP-binding protein [Deltaproteobacteria bacterium]|jgi:small GTP-binding protein|nr:GTP-binding protein [Deltaproteobacteria bacterium]